MRDLPIRNLLLGAGLLRAGLLAVGLIEGGAIGVRVGLLAVGLVGLLEVGLLAVGLCQAADPLGSAAQGVEGLGQTPHAAIRSLPGDQPLAGGPTNRAFCGGEPFAGRARISGLDGLAETFDLGSHSAANMLVVLLALGGLPDTLERGFVIGQGFLRWWFWGAHTSPTRSECRCWNQFGGTDSLRGKWS